MEILTQHHWTQDELRAAGFRFYRRKKTVILARELPEEEAQRLSMWNLTHWSPRRVT